jgi:hypothetical protein
LFGSIDRFLYTIGTCVTRLATRQGLVMTGKRRGRWFSYSLRTMLLVVTLLALVLGRWVNSSREQRIAVDTIRNHFPHHRCEYDYELERFRGVGGFTAIAGVSNSPASAPRNWIPRFLRDRLGKDYFHSIESVVFGETFYATDRPGPEKNAAAWKAISGIWNLRQLTSYLEPDDSDLAHLAGLRHLNHVDLMICPDITDESLVWLSRVPNLETLTLTGGQFTPSGFAHLARLRHLKSLQLVSPLHSRSQPRAQGAVDITDADLEQIAQLTGLEELTLRSSGISDRGLARLATLTGLKKVEIASPMVTGACFEHLTSLQNLEQVTLYLPELTDGALQFLARFPSLRFAEFHDTKIDGSGFKHFPKETALESLYLDGPYVTDEVVGYLAGFAELHNLQLRRTRVTAAALEQLHNIPGLKQIGLEPAVSGDAKSLKQALPKCSVINGGFPL